MKIRNELGICTHCNIKKDLTEFSKDKRSAYGLRPECKSCERKRGSYYIKSIKSRLNHFPQWYGDIKLEITSKDIDNIANICFFCKEVIEDKMSIHRIDHSGNYSVANIAKVHKTCHAIHGGHNTKPNPSKGFGSMDKLKADEARKKAYMIRKNNRKRVV